MDGVYVVILVTCLILGEEDVLAMARPEVSGNRPLCFGGDGLRTGERLGRLLYPDIARAFEGFNKGDEGAIRGNLRAGDFRVAEEQLAVDHRRTLRPIRHCE